MQWLLYRVDKYNVHSQAENTKYSCLKCDEEQTEGS